jgi:hypothetical protein
MDRRRFITLGTIGGAAFLAGCREPQKATSPAADRFVMLIKDGYAFMLPRSGARVVMGTLDVPNMPHPLLLKVQNGTVATKGTVPYDEQKRIYNLTGKHVVVDFDTTVPLTLPAALAPTKLDCQTAAQNWNSLAWIPPITKIYPDAKLRTNWRSILDSRLVINKGTLNVVDGVDGFFEFKTAPAASPVHTQPLSDRLKLEATLTSKTVRFKIFKKEDVEPQSTDTPEGTLEITAVDGVATVDLAVSFPELTGSYAPNAPIEHFGRYKELIETNSETVVPYFRLCATGGGNCPGDFCPQARFEIES